MTPGCLSEMDLPGGDTSPVRDRRGQGFQAGSIGSKMVCPECLAEVCQVIRIVDKSFWRARCCFYLYLLGRC